MLDGLVSRLAGAPDVPKNALAFLWRTGHHSRPVDALRERLQKNRLIESHFPGLAPSEIDLLLSVAQLETRSPDERLVLQGEPAELLYLVIEGNVCVDTTHGPLVLFGAQWIGEFSMLYGGTANATATALTPIECLVWDRTPLAALLTEHPSLDQNFRTMLARAMTAKLGSTTPSP
jgi:CRP-like cAMP-binding protein